MSAGVTVFCHAPIVEISLFDMPKKQKPVNTESYELLILLETMFAGGPRR
jgi:hypothetical protein